MLTFVLTMANKTAVKERKKILLRKVPEDIQQIIINTQDEEKELCECIRSQEHSIYKMIREWNRLFSEKKMAYLVINGEYFGSDDFGVDISGDKTEITIRIPNYAGIAMALNYKRIEGQEK